MKYVRKHIYVHDKLTLRISAIIMIAKVINININITVCDKAV